MKIFVMPLPLLGLCVQIVFFVPYLSLATKGVNTLDDAFSAGKTMVIPLKMLPSHYPDSSNCQADWHREHDW